MQHLDGAALEETETAQVEGALQRLHDALGSLVEDENRVQFHLDGSIQVMGTRHIKWQIID
jgi:hypothetical protein